MLAPLLCLPAAAGPWTEGRGAAIPPPGYLSMCAETPALCLIDRRPGAEPRVMSKADWTALLAVNRAVNDAITPQVDQGDHWRIGASSGDCEDYALTKRDQLLRLGWRASDLLIATAETAFGEAHAVLIARTDAGDYVLDNLTDSVLRWDETALRLTSRQSERLPALWVRL
ncbi:MAG: transglutaminase-like cysteine peptidase [Pseudomonadota bacterium]